MSIVNAWQNKRKEEEEEKKVVGQQQKTQPKADKPVGSTSIPKDNQEGRTQQSAASSSRQEQRRSEPRREESKQNIIRRNTITANRDEQRQNNTRNTSDRNTTQNRTRQTNTRQNRFTDYSGNDLSQRRDTGTWGYNKTVDDARSRYAQSLKDKNNLPGPDDLPAVGSGMQQLSNINDYANKNANFDFSGKETKNSRKEAERELENILHNRDQKLEDAKKDASTMNSFIGGVANSSLGTLGDLIDLVSPASRFTDKSTEGMTPDEIYNRAMNTGPSWDNLYGNNIYNDYNAYKNYVLDQMASGAVTPEEIRKMQDLETKFSTNPAHYLSELGKDARTYSEGFSEGHKIANFAGNMVPMLLGNAAVSKLVAPAVAGAEKLANPVARVLATQGANLIPDVMVDTVPEAVRNINEGKSPQEVAKQAAINVGLNEVANLGSELAPKALKGMLNRANSSNVVKQAGEETAEQIIREASPDVVEQAVKELAGDTTEQTVKEAAPEVAEEVVQNVPKTPISNYLNQNQYAWKEMDKELDNIGKVLGSDRNMDAAFTNVIDNVQSENADDAIKALNDFDMAAKNNGYDVSGNIDKVKRLVTGETAKNVGEDIFDNTVKATDNISSTLNKYANANMSDKAKTEFATAMDEIATYKEAVMTGGDVKEAGRKLNNTLSRLNTAMKGVDGYEGEFGSKAFKDQLNYNTYLHGKQNPTIVEDAEADKMIQDWIDNEGESYKPARPANQIPGADDLAENAPKQIDDIAESTVKNTDNTVPDIEEPKPQMEVPKTEAVDRGPEGPLVDDGVKRERGYARSTRNNPDIPDEVAAEFVDNPEIYNVLHNKDTKAKAQSILDQGFDKAYADYKDLLNKKDPAAVPLGYDLAKQMIDNGDSSGAADLIRDMSKSLTESGQFSQAAAITLMKNDPMTALRYAEKEIDALNTDGAKKFGKKWNDFKLTDDEIKAFSELEPGDKEGIAKLFDKIGTRLGKEYPTTTMEKLLEARRIGMLFNVRTNVRNLGANIPTLGMRWASDRVDAIGQNIAHIINPDFKVTQSLTGSGAKGRKLATEVFNSDKVQALLKNTDGKYTDSVKGALVKEKQMYKGTAIDHWIDKMTGGGLQKLNEKAFGKKGVQSIPETIRNATYKALELGDSPFVKENFVERLGSYIKAQGYNSIDEIPDEAIETAWEAAMKATYKDQSWAYKMIRDIKQGIEQAGKPGRVASESLIPFVQAPGNIAARMVDYSPIGGVNGIKNIIKGAKSGNEKAVREGINQLAQGATGSLALGIGIALHNSGIISGGYSQDKDKKSHEKNNGFREYALHIGNHYYTIDWAQPAFQTIMSGVLLADAINKSDEYDSDLLNYFGVKGSTAGKVIGGTKEAAKTTLNAWFNASPLQSMQDLLGGTYEDSSDIASKLWSVAAENFAGSYIPASVNAIAKTADTTQRQTYDPSSKTASFVNQQIAKIPGASKNLPAKYNTWGEEIKTAGSTGEAAFNKFVNPGEGTTENKKPIDTELDRLFDATGNNAVFPQVAPNKVNGEALTAKQVSELQKDMGEQSYKAATKFMDSDVYKSMTDEQKAEGYNDLYTTAKWAAQLKLTDPELYKQMQNGDEEALKTITGNGATMKKEYITGGIDAVLDGMKTDAAFDKAGISKSDKAKAIYETEGEEGLMKYAEQKKTFDAVGAPETDKAKEIYEAEGKEGLGRYAQYYNAAKEASGGDSVTAAGIVEALKDESPEVQKEMMDNLMPNMAEKAKKANENYSNGSFKFYKYKTEADTDKNGHVSADESHAYFDALDIPGTEKAYFDIAIRDNAKTSIYDGTAKKSTSNKKKTETKLPDVEPTGNSDFDTLMKAKQKAREDYAKNPKSDSAIPDAGSWSVNIGGTTYDLHDSNGYKKAQSLGVPDNDWLQMYKETDSNGNGRNTKAEVKAYVNELVKLGKIDKSQRADYFDMLNGTKAKNPYR